MRVVLGLIVPIFGMIVWEQAAARGTVSPLLFPAPSSIFASAVSLFESGALGEHLTSSLSLAISGLVCGGLSALSAGILVGLSKKAEEILSPTLLIIQIVPGLALLPLLVLLFGGDQSTKVLIVSIAVFFPIYLNTVHGIRGADLKLVECGQLLGYSSARIVWSILLPSALPMIFVGIRQSLKLAWVGVVGVELFIASSAGITYMMVEARSFSQSTVVYLGLLLYALLGILFDLILTAIERIALKWNRKVREQ